MARYSTIPAFSHDKPPSAGVLITNLGTPEAASVPAVRRYLGEFLADPRVVEMPRWLWLPILHGLILRTRPRRSAEMYRKVWTPEGSPLLVNSKRQAEALTTEFKRRFSGPVHIALGMRYGFPSLKDGLESLRRANVQRLLILPLYPQYSATTTASTFDAIADLLKTWRWLPELRFVAQYHDEPGYIEALVHSIREYWLAHGQPDRLLFSFHGIPQAYFLAGDPYHCQCQLTARLVAEALSLRSEQWRVTFQSRLGPKQWLKPYTDAQLGEWAKAGVARVDLICPGFAADCLETLEENAIRNRELFLQAGGKTLNYIPALNDRPDHIAALADLAARHMHGWPELAADWKTDTAATRERALAMGAKQ
jgi:ferrochelatase